MKPVELEEEIAVELEALEATVNELFDEALASALAPYRRFRHIAFHEYGFRIDWNRMAAGVTGVADVFSQFKGSLSEYLDRIND